MKLLYCCHADNYHIERWIPALQKVGIDVHVLTLRPNPKLDVPQHCVTPIFSKITWLDFWVLAPQIRQVYQEINADALLCSFASTYGLAGFLSGIKPLFIQTWSRDIGADSSVNKKDALISRWISRLICGKAAGITTDGPHFKTFVEKNWSEIPPNKILSTWWGIDTSFWTSSKTDKQNARKQLGISEKQKVIISPRGVFWYYRPKVVLKALLRILDEDNDAYVIIPTLNHIRDKQVNDLLNELKAHSRALVKDYFLEMEAFRTLLFASDILLSVPLFDGISEVIQEGMACSLLPVLNPIPANLVFKSENFQVLMTKNSQPKEDELVDILKQALQKIVVGDYQQPNKELVQLKCDVHKTANNLVRFIKTMI